MRQIIKDIRCRQWPPLAETCFFALLTVVLFRRSPGVLLSDTVVSPDSVSPTVGGTPIPFFLCAHGHPGHAALHRPYLPSPWDTLTPWGFKSLEGRDFSFLYSQSPVLTDLTVHKCSSKKSMNYLPSVINQAKTEAKSWETRASDFFSDPGLSSVILISLSEDGDLILSHFPKKSWKEGSRS